MPLINDEPEPTRLGLSTALDSSKVRESESVSHSVVFDSLQLHRLCSPPGSSVLGISQARILERAAFLLQGMFSTQGSNLGLLHSRQILYHLRHHGSPRIGGRGEALIMANQVLRDPPTRTRILIHISASHLLLGPPHSLLHLSQQFSEAPSTLLPQGLGICYVPCLGHHAQVYTLLFLWFCSNVTVREPHPDYTPGPESITVGCHCLHCFRAPHHLNCTYMYMFTICTPQRNINQLHEGRDTVHFVHC